MIKNKKNFFYIQQGIKNKFFFFFYLLSISSCLLYSQTTEIRKFKFEEKKSLTNEIKKNNTSYIINGKPQIKIDKKTEDYTIILSSEMDKALKEYEKRHGYLYNVLNVENFQKDIINSYPFETYQSPSAVFGDFNDDGIIDVALMGDNVIEIISNTKKTKKKEKTDDIVMMPISTNIAIPEKKEEEEKDEKYVIIEIVLLNFKEEYKDHRPKNVDLYLTFHKKGEIIDSHNKGCAPETNGIITLKKDAFGIQNFDWEGKETLFNYTDTYASIGCCLLSH